MRLLYLEKPFSDSSCRHKCRQAGLVLFTILERTSRTTIMSHWERTIKPKTILSNISFLHHSILYPDSTIIPVYSRLHSSLSLPVFCHNARLQGQTQHTHQLRYQRRSDHSDHQQRFPNGLNGRCDRSIHRVLYGSSQGELFHGRYHYRC